MTDAFFDAVSKSLDAKFKLPVFADNVEQGLNPPCFIVSATDINQKHIAMQRYSQEQGFDIQYFPANQDDGDELRNVAERLFDILEFIRLPKDGMVHGKHMHWKIIDKVLHFYVDYPIFLLKTREKPLMEKLHIKR